MDDTFWIFFVFAIHQAINVLLVFTYSCRIFSVSLAITDPLLYGAKPHVVRVVVVTRSVAEGGLTTSKSHPVRPFADTKS